MQVFLPYLWLHTAQMREALLLSPFAAFLALAKTSPVSTHFTRLPMQKVLLHHSFQNALEQAFQFRDFVFLDYS